MQNLIPLHRQSQRLRWPQYWQTRIRYSAWSAHDHCYTILTIAYMVLTGVAQLCNRDLCDGTLAGQSHLSALPSATLTISVPVCPMPTLLCQNDSSVIMDAYVKESANAPFLSQTPHRLCFPLYACDQDMGTKLQQPLSIRATTSAVDGEPQKMLNLLATDGSQEGSSAERSADLSVLTNLNDGSCCCFLQCVSRVVATKLTTLVDSVIPGKHPRTGCWVNCTSHTGRWEI